MNGTYKSENTSRQHTVAVRNELKGTDASAICFKFCVYTVCVCLLVSHTKNIGYRAEKWNNGYSVTVVPTVLCSSLFVNGQFSYLLKRSNNNSHACIYYISYI
jgi:hypothetical protein